MFKLRIHCWGGLGSQLYSLALALDLLKRFPYRKICILFHTGGVTFRNLEIVNLPNNFEYKFIDDFIKTTNNEPERLVSNNFMKFLKNLLLKLGFISAANTTSEFNDLKPWVITIRGHYSHRLINYSTLDQMEKYLKLGELSTSSTLKNKSQIALHYRLGDLSLKKKSSIVQIDRVCKIINELKKSSIFQSIDVFSDSSRIELDESLIVFKPIDINYVELDPLRTINYLREYDFFIGTNSKISIWTIILRLKDNSLSINYCPENLLPLLKNNIGFLDKAINLKTY